MPQTNQFFMVFATQENPSKLGQGHITENDESIKVPKY